MKEYKKDTKIINLGRSPKDYHGVVNPPVYRCSTVIYQNTDEMKETYEKRFDKMFYGRYGTPTTFALEEAVANLEGGYRSIAVCSGLSAITLTLLAFLRQGDHILITDSVYGPTREFCETTIKNFGIEVDFYNPKANEQIKHLIKENTKIIYCESPGSLSFEMQDIPKISKIAKQNDILIVADNTWATPVGFKPFEKGVDVSIQAGTKYIVGHSDAMLGMITTTKQHYEKLKTFVASSGVSVGSEEAFLGLRGLRTISVRLKQHQKNAKEFIKYLQTKEQIKKIYYPALETDEGYEIYKRDFSYNASLFSIELDEKFSDDDIDRLLNSLEIFSIGFSWGGFESLIIPVRHLTRDTNSFSPKGKVLRLHVGLEDTNDLIDDFENGLKILTGKC